MDFLNKLLSEKPSDYAADFLTFIPELKSCVGFDQKNPWHHLDVWNHILYAMDLSPKNKIVRMSLLLHDIGKPETMTIDDNGIGHFFGHPLKGYEMSKEILIRFDCFNDEERNNILYLIKHHDSPIGQTDKTLKKKIKNLGENLDNLIEVQKADALAHNPEKLDQRIKILEDVDKRIKLLRNEEKQ